MERSAGQSTVLMPPEIQVAAVVTHPDEDLLRGLRSRSSEAYEKIMDRFEMPLYRFFFYSHGDHDQAMDQCSETFANLVSAIPKMRAGAEGLRGFVFGVARNVMRRGWRKRSPAHAPLTALDHEPDERPSAYREAAAREELRLALAAIRTLDDPARQIMLLRFVEELSLVEIVDAMKIPLGTVKSHIHRSRRKLCEMLGRPR